MRGPWLDGTREITSNPAIGGLRPSMDLWLVPRLVWVANRGSMSWALALFRSGW